MEHVGMAAYQTEIPKERQWHCTDHRQTDRCESTNKEY
jgi:hypothetical protein